MSTKVSNKKPELSDFVVEDYIAPEEKPKQELNWWKRVLVYGSLAVIPAMFFSNQELIKPVSYEKLDGLFPTQVSIQYDDEANKQRLSIIADKDHFNFVELQTDYQDDLNKAYLSIHNEINNGDYEQLRAYGHHINDSTFALKSVVIDNLKTHEYDSIVFK